MTRDLNPTEVDHPACKTIADQAQVSVTGSPTERLVWRSWGCGSIVMLLHGGAGSWRQWIETIPALSESRRVLVPDLPGFGDSDLLRERSFGSIARALASGLETLSLSPTTRIDVVGFSFGAVVATRFAAEQSQRVRHLVLVGANLVDQTGPKMTGLQNWRDKSGAEQQASIRHNLAATMLSSGDSDDDLAFSIYQHDLQRSRLRASTLEDMRPLPDDLCRLLDSIQIDLICGERDQVFQHVANRQASRLAELRPGSTFAEITDAGH